MSNDHAKKSSESKVVMIYRAQNPREAHVIRIALEEGGIRTFIEGEVLQSVVGEVPPWDAAPRILVEESQAMAARAIIEGVNTRRAIHSGPNESDEKSACLACGHLMPDAAVKCPSCGWTYQESE
jgi:hypothetical protein